MPATPDATLIAPDALAGIRSGDERAFETLFRARYQSLLDEAKRKLEDPESAPRVVERAFVKVWGAREKLDSPEEFEACLHEAVRDGAAVEAKRRAVAHRMASLEGAKAAGKHEKHGPVTIEDSWKHVVAMLHAPAHSAEEQAKLGRHSAAEHISEMSKPKSIVLPLVVAALVVTVIAVVLVRASSKTADPAINAALESNAAVERKTEVAQRGALTLDDSTGVSLGAQTVLRVARKFNVENRAVRLNGTAAFDVKRAGELPFKLKAKDVWVTATGTKFEARAYANEPVITIRVREGTVEVKTGETLRTLSSGQAVVVDSAGAISDANAGTLANALGWTEGNVMIKSSLRDALPEVYRWYGLTIAAPDASHLNLPVDVTIPLDSVQRAIKALEASTGLMFGYAGQNMILYDPKNKPKGLR